LNIDLTLPEILTEAS